MASKKKYMPRVSERVEAGLLVKVIHDDGILYGITADLSKGGMCIRTGRCLPDSACGDIIIPVGNDYLIVPFSVKWSDVLHGFYDVMGVKLKRTPRGYRKIVDQLKSSALSSESA